MCFIAASKSSWLLELKPFLGLLFQGQGPWCPVVPPSYRAAALVLTAAPALKEPVANCTHRAPGPAHPQPCTNGPDRISRHYQKLAHVLARSSTTEQNKAASLLLLVYRVVRTSCRRFAALGMSTWFWKFSCVGKTQI